MQPYGYLRKSRVLDLATSFGPETQEREIRGLAARFGDNGDRLVLKSDWDISGDAKHTDKRLGYLELVAAIESGKCSAVYAYSLSRLGRSVQQLSILFDLCRDHDVPIRLVADSIDTSTASGKLLGHILASLAQFESDVAGERRRAQIQSKRARGESLRTRRFYGEGDGENADLVLATYRETGSYARTAKILNEKGIQARSGGPWYATSVKLVVQRLDPTIRSQGRGVKAKVAFRFARLLRCPTCGTYLTGSTSKGQPRYVCSNYAAMPHERISISERQILPAIEAEAARLRVPGDTLDWAEGSADRHADLDAKRTRVIDMYAEGLITDKADRDRRLVAIEDERATIIDERVMTAIPNAINFDWPVQELNASLRAIWTQVDLDANLLPVSAEWRVPEWRS